MAQKSKIVVVNDDERLLRILSMLLKSAGHDVVGALTGNEGLHLVGEERPDLVLLDVVLPDINGIDVCRQLKADPATADIFVALMSGFRKESDDQAAGLEGGADEYIVWPVSNRELLARVHTLLRLKRTEQELVRHRDQLEEVVAERTAELESTLAEVKSLNERLQQEVAERKQAEVALRKSEQHFRLLYEQAPLGYQSLDENGCFLEVNQAWLDMLGYERAEVIGHWFGDFLAVHEQEPFRERFPRFLAAGEICNVEIEVAPKSGDRKIVSIDGRIGHDRHGNFRQTHCILHDITRRKQTEQEREITIEVLRLINSKLGLPDLMAALLAFLKTQLDFEAAAVRLRDGADFPYYEARGFPETFVLAENSLCTLDEKGEVIRDGAGNPVLECMCGNIICGRIDPAQPFFTEQGSFWTNSTTALLANTTEEDLLARTRNRCHGEGYESVGLIPLRVGAETFGLLQFNDSRPDRFTPDMIALLERVANNVAIGLAHRRVQAELRESEELHRVTMENILDPVFITDDAGRFTFICGNVQQVLGYTAAEMEALGHISWVVGDDLFDPTDLKRAGEIPNIERVIPDKEGQDHVFLITVKRVSIKEGTVLYVCRDITERKQAAEALRESEEKYRELVDNANSAIIRMDVEGRIEFFNEFAQHFFGYSQAEILGKNVVGTIVPEQESTGRNLSTIVADAYHDPEKFGENENENVLKSGERVWLSWRNKLLRDEAGNISGWLCVGSDITRRKKLEAELWLRSEMLENISEGISLTTSAAEGIFVYTSPSFEAMFGYEPGELIGQHVSIINGPGKESPREKADKIARKLEEEGVWQEEIQNVRKDGATFWCNAHVTGFENPHYGQVWVSVHEDITERKQAEAALRESEEKFRGIFAESPISILIYDGTGQLVEANPAALHSFGLADLNQVKGISIFENPNITPEIKEKLLRREIVRFQSTVDFDNIRRLGFYDPTRTGIAHLDWVIAPFGEQGYLVQIQEITERVAAEKRLRQSEARFRLTTRAGSTGVWDWSLETDEIYLDPFLKEMLGYRDHEIKNHMDDWLKYVDPDDVEKISAAVEAVIQDRAPELDIEHRMLRKDGRTCWFLARGLVIRDETGKPYRLVGTDTDVTERKQMEESLRQRNRELAFYNQAAQTVSSSLDLDQVLTTVLEEVRTLLEVVACSIWLLDPAGDTLICRHVIGPRSESVRGWRLPVTDGVAGWTARHGQSLIIPDVHQEARHFKGVDRQTGLPIRSILSVPLLVQQAVIGVLQVVDAAVDRFGETDLRLLEPLAASAAIAIENARLFEQVETGREQQQALSRRLIEVQERERRHIARELHDEIGQILTGLNLMLEISARVPDDNAGGRLDEARLMVEELMEKVDELSLDLRPAMLDDLGLLPTLLWHIDRYTAQTEVLVRLKHAGLERRFAPEIETAAYRVVQEALTNVARHAGVKEVAVRLRTDQHLLRVEVADEGAGFDPEAVRAGGSTSGLSGMQERAVLLGGRLTVESRPGQGARIITEWPLTAKK